MPPTTFQPLRATVGTPSPSRTVEQEEQTDEATDVPWNVVVHNDPITNTNYVTMVFQKVFGYPREKSQKHMWEVHRRGRSIVWCGRARTRGTVRRSSSTATSSSPRWKTLRSE